jgi:hypothetical protein
VANLLVKEVPKKNKQIKNIDKKTKLSINQNLTTSIILIKGLVNFLKSHIRYIKKKRLYHRSNEGPEIWVCGI